jgi:hypothetical protein
MYVYILISFSKMTTSQKVCILFTRSEVLEAVTMKIAVFWDMTLYQRFGGTCFLHLPLKPFYQTARCHIPDDRKLHFCIVSLMKQWKTVLSHQGSNLKLMISKLG